eukprot:TRINITY_DN2875_c1_g1::TRINITY_DN2875_c1_g1_i1::g.6035::m.6035 TRINITY_DN2875_c1_g1::TRINITY_DN2875_c1_g1_i1::g.6035  ORF type:complete len:167 (-),score=26.20,COPI_assoc/PF08507.5/6.5e-29,DUF3784/PF12650.2/0.16,DUF3784/PF12650.2/52,DUF308/PF03729.8/0.091,DUF308/PF03729.8/3.1e+03,E1-E2_ATPase/PF00122.15/6.4 TRINITY_DN2875_c1_g1_i1:385-831(-)
MGTINLNRVASVLSIVCAILMVVAGIIRLTHAGTGTDAFQIAVVGFYLVVFGLLLSLVELRAFAVLTRHFGFLFSWIGKGLFFIFVACLLFGISPFHTAAGVVIILVGIFFICLQFVPSTKSPEALTGKKPDAMLENAHPPANQVPAV